MAQGWLALELTNSAFLVGLVATASSHPDPVLHDAGRGDRRPVGQAADRADRPGRLPDRGVDALGAHRDASHHHRLAARARVHRRHHRVDRDPGAAGDDDRPRRPRRPPGRDRPELERLQPRARRRARNRRRGDRAPRHRVVLLPQRGELRRRAVRPVHDAAAALRAAAKPHEPVAGSACRSCGTCAIRARSAR